jgi:uncharacterized membrane protein
VIPTHGTVPIGELYDYLGGKTGIAMQALDGSFCQKFTPISFECFGGFGAVCTKLFGIVRSTIIKVDIVFSLFNKMNYKKWELINDIF